MMKKWISLVTCVACAFSSLAYGEEALAAPEAIVNETLVAAAEPGLITQEQARQSVGKAAGDGSSSARGSSAGKYILAAGAIAIGVAAILLIARHHHHHGGQGAQSHSH
jgi:hypothetical protein